MKGKQAAAAARRREAEALEAVEKVKGEKAEQKARYEAEINGLREELAGLRNNVRAEAARLADQEIQRLLAEKEAERQARGLSEAALEALADRKDALVREACRYVSMHQGCEPMRALRQVITWMSGQRYEGQITESWLIEQGLPHDGWALTLFRANRYADRAQRAVTGYATVTLDEAEAEARPDIHPGYRPDWYAGHERAVLKARTRQSRKER